MSTLGIQQYSRDGRGAFVEVGDEISTIKFYGQNAAEVQRKMASAQTVEKVKNVARGVLLAASIVLFAVFVGSSAAHRASAHLGIAHLKSWKVGFGGGLGFGALSVGSCFAIHSGRTMGEALEKAQKQFKSNEFAKQLHTAPVDDL